MTTTALTAPAPLTASNPQWLQLKAAATALQALQVQDGSVPDAAAHEAAAGYVETITAAVSALAPSFPHDARYLELLVADFGRWADGGFGVPDFLDSLQAFQPQQHRVNGLQHLVVFPMYTQNGSSNRFVEAVLIEVIWPEFIGGLEEGEYSNKLFVPIRFLDFTPGYDTNSAVLFPESVAVRHTPTFTWGGDLRRPRGCPLPPRAARRRRNHFAAAARGRGGAAGGPGPHAGNFRHVGPDP